MAGFNGSFAINISATSQAAPSRLTQPCCFNGSFAINISATPGISLIITAPRCFNGSFAINISATPDHHPALRHVQIVSMAHSP